MKITVNNKERQVADGSTMADVLAMLEIEPKGIATAVNGRLVAADGRHAATLAEGDKMVIISAFYGG